MSKSDSISKKLMQNNGYFADVVNYVLFGGKEIVIPEELQELDTSELTIVDDAVKRSIPIQRYRDVLKQAVLRQYDNFIFAIIGIENQTSIHYAMPVKNYLYDAIRYAKQVEKKTSEYRKNKEKLTSEEFLSGWKKTDTLIPVITITVYYGAEEWDGARSIHEMFDKKLNLDLLSLIPDYRIHLLEPCKIENWDSFKTDVGLLFHAIARINLEFGVEDLLKGVDSSKSIDTVILNAINYYTDMSFAVENEEEEDMSFASKTSEVRSMVKTCIYFGKTLEETLEYILSCYPADKDITPSYVTEKYNQFSQK